jgi:glycerol uptake facilitator-like aquaporin
MSRNLTDCHAFGAGTALLLFTVFAVVDPGRNQSVIHVAALGLFAIGMAVFVAHLALIPITGACRSARARLALRRRCWFADVAS